MWSGEDVSASDPLEWIKHALERLESELHELRSVVLQIQRALVEIEARERERDRQSEQRRRDLDVRLRIVQFLIPTGLIGAIVALWQWLRGHTPWGS
jgi:hypothetical protein